MIPTCRDLIDIGLRHDMFFYHVSTVQTLFLLKNLVCRTTRTPLIIHRYANHVISGNLLVCSYTATTKYGPHSPSSGLPPTTFVEASHRCTHQSFPIKTTCPQAIFIPHNPLILAMSASNASFSPLAHIVPTNPTEWVYHARVSISVTLLSAIVLAVLFFRPDSHSDDVYEIGGIPILATWTFFSKRYDWIREQFRKSGGKTFRFRILQVLL